ncbi:PREDICTED: cell differentiation protein RCD1 homolog isoform X2 [Lupinus angustifolius]|uniref:cell differentiation protein RCD1 homolog isoform X2 n=1 Tax=Lupinus angustifolius TaxID=3871 RepID=UPI00092ED315|nr:PREDICTED: cell differentiation protein RCD1 homolog isoform X2 [Lupinus angustifolius]
MTSLQELVNSLCIPNVREQALFELSTKTELFDDLAILLWASSSVMTALLQEIIAIYPDLSNEALTLVQSNKVCNILALFQCIASHPDTRMPFISAQMPIYVYPLLNTRFNSKPFEYLRLASVGVIGALVKVDDTKVITFLTSTEVMPMCLFTMDVGSELTKTVATFIVQKILLDDVGLQYVCASAERFTAVVRGFRNMLAYLAEKHSPRLFKRIIRCYLCLSEDPRGGDALRRLLPTMLTDGTFTSYIHDDPTTRAWVQQLLEKVGVNRVPGVGGELDRLMNNMRI